MGVWVSDEPSGRDRGCAGFQCSLYTTIIGTAVPVLSTTTSMNFEYPPDLVAHLASIDQFITSTILPLQHADDNNRFFDHRREYARTNWDAGGLPRKEWEELLSKSHLFSDSRHPILTNPSQSSSSRRLRRVLPLRPAQSLWRHLAPDHQPLDVCHPAAPSLAPSLRRWRISRQ